MNNRPIHLSQPAATANPAFERKIRLSRMALFFERLWPRAWSLIALGALFLITSLLGLWPQLSEISHAALLGGHVRVGLEDSIFIERGVLATSNAQQVAKIVRILAELGIEPATPAEAREILGLKGGDRVAF